jgi:hypothetical protein
MNFGLDKIVNELERQMPSSPRKTLVLSRSCVRSCEDACSSAHTLTQGLDIDTDPANQPKPRNNQKNKFSSEFLTQLIGISSMHVTWIGVCTMVNGSASCLAYATRCRDERISRKLLIVTC